MHQKIRTVRLQGTCRLNSNVAYRNAGEVRIEK